jgi:hypothetical protein
MRWFDEWLDLLQYAPISIYIFNIQSVELRRNVIDDSNRHHGRRYCEDYLMCCVGIAKMSTDAAVISCSFKFEVAFKFAESST